LNNYFPSCCKIIIIIDFGKWVGIRVRVDIPRASLEKLFPISKITPHKVTTQHGLLPEDGFALLAHTLLERLGIVDTDATIEKKTNIMN